MSKADCKPAGAPWIIPYLCVRSSEEAIDFYQRAFGFNLRNSMPNKEGKVIHAEMGWEEGVIMFSPEGSYGSTMRTPEHSGVSSPIVLYVYCEDVDALCRRAKEAGAKILNEPGDMFWGDRICQIQDPDNYQWTFATRVGEFDFSKVPPG